MAKISWNPKSRAKGQKPSPIAWGCYVYMREDGSFETEFKGETGFLMMKAAVEGWGFLVFEEASTPGHP